MSRIVDERLNTIPSKILHIEKLNDRAQISSLIFAVDRFLRVLQNEAYFRMKLLFVYLSVGYIISKEG